jgi:peptidoglycan/LPS O-acetylase OafA/YrhL
VNSADLAHRADTRLPTLTGLRFVAVAMVFGFHFSHELLFSDDTAGLVFLIIFVVAGPVGVSFFFALSGFVLTWNAKPGEPARLFWRRRAAKILPSHAVTWLAALLLTIWAGKEVLTEAALSNLLLVQSWIPDTRIFFSMNDVSWSLSCEAFFYLAFPLIFRYVARIRTDRLWRWVFGVTVLIFLVPLLAKITLPDQPRFIDTPVPQLWAVYNLPLARALEFVLGMLMARIVREGRWIRLGVGRAALIALIAYVLTPVVPLLWSYVAVCALPMCLLVAAAASADIEGRRSRLRGRTMVWLGEVSFACYLVHRLILVYGHRAIGPDSKWSTPVVALLFAVAAGLTVLLAWLLYTYVEKPFMRRFSRPSSRARPERDRPGDGGP